MTAFKATVDEILAKQDEPGGEAEVTTADVSTAKLFEEIKVMFQDLPSRIDSMAERSRFGPRGRRRELHPGMLEEFVMMSSRRQEPNIGVAALIMDLREQTRGIQRFAFVAVLDLWSAAPSRPHICRCFVASQAGSGAGRAAVEPSGACSESCWFVRPPDGPDSQWLRAVDDGDK